MPTNEEQPLISADPQLLEAYPGEVEKTARSIYEQAVASGEISGLLSWGELEDHYRQIWHRFARIQIVKKRPGEITPETIARLAQAGYEGYSARTGGKTFDGRQMPAWADLPPHTVEAWKAASHAIVAAIHHEP